jgi:hypothetical protein
MTDVADGITETLPQLQEALCRIENIIANENITEMSEVHLLLLVE